MNSTDQTLFAHTMIPHPGDTVQEYLECYGWSQSDLARRAGLSAKTISEICNGKAPISPSTALAFEKTFQRPAHLWLNLQTQFDEAEARHRHQVKSKDWSEWAKGFPVKEMRKLRFSLPTASSDIEGLLKFFGVSSPESWASVWRASSVAYRQTSHCKFRQESIAAWVRETEIVARELTVAEFNEEQLRSSLEDLRRLTRERCDEIMDPIQDICAAAGVAVVLVPAIPGTGISGCARWLNDKRALIGLTLRYKTEDQLWFTLFHEIAHILLHRHKRTFVLDNAAHDLGDRIVDPDMEQLEEEANRFSRDTLIPPKKFSDFLRHGEFASEAIHDFAEKIGVGPGIVVGRLQHDGILEPHQGNTLKQKLDWGFAN